MVAGSKLTTVVYPGRTAQGREGTGQDSGGDAKGSACLSGRLVCSQIQLVNGAVVEATCS